MLKVRFMILLLAIVQYGCAQNTEGDDTTRSSVTEEAVTGTVTTESIVTDTPETDAVTETTELMDMNSTLCPPMEPCPTPVPCPTTTTCPVQEECPPPPVCKVNGSCPDLPQCPCVIVWQRRIITIQISPCPVNDCAAIPTCADSVEECPTPTTCETHPPCPDDSTCPSIPTCTPGVCPVDPRLVVCSLLCEYSDFLCPLWCNSLEFKK